MSEGGAKVGVEEEWEYVERKCEGGCVGKEAQWDRRRIKG